MNCPHCNVKLFATQYEKVRVQVCTSCGGHFVESQKLDSIRRRKDTSVSGLIDEIAAAPEVVPMAQRVLCPRCRGPMTPEKQNAVVFDRCTGCKAVWLDGGELARYQLYFEVSDAGLDARAFQSRLENISDAERFAYETMLQKLKQPMFLTREDVELFSGFLSDLYFG